MTTEELLLQFDKLTEPALKECWIREYYKIAVHSQALNPAKIIFRRHQNEDEICWKWRLENYECITKPVIMRAFSALSRIFQDSGFSISTSDLLNELIYKRIYGGMDFLSYFQTRVIKAMIEDPNGFLVWAPMSINENLALNESTVDIYFKPIIINSKNIHYFDDNILIYKCEYEKSEINNGQKNVKTGDVFWLYDKTQIIKIKQIGSITTKQYEAEVIYIHNLGELPAILFGGYWDLRGYFESFFAQFVPFANEALRQFSDWQVIMANSAYPIKEIGAIKCSHPGCESGVIYERDENRQILKQQNCSACGGTGFVMSTGPFGALVRPENNTALGIEYNASIPLLRYITPPVEILDYAQKAWQMLLKKAEDALHLNFTDAAQSGVAKAYDREDLYAMLAEISTNFYDHLMFGSLSLLERLYAAARVVKPIEPTVTKPISFNIRSEEQLQNDFKTFSEMGVAKDLAAEMLIQLADKRFSGSGVPKKITQTLLQYDPLYLNTADEKLAKVSAGIITENDIIRSDYSLSAILRLIEKNGQNWFKSVRFELIFAELDKFIAPFLIENITKNDLVTNLPNLNG